MRVSFQIIKFIPVFGEDKQSNEIMNRGRRRAWQGKHAGALKIQKKTEKWPFIPGKEMKESTREIKRRKNC